MNNTLKNRISVAAAVAALFLGSSAPAQVIFFGQMAGAGEGIKQVPNATVLAAQSNFLGALLTPGVEDFEGAFGTTAVFGNGVTATLIGGVLVNQPTGAAAGRYPISGGQFWTSVGAFTLTFDQGIAAFGFFGVDIGDFNGQLSLTLFNGATNLGNFVVPNTINGAGGSILYYGIVTPFSFDRVVFGNTAAGNDVFGFDDFTIGLPSQVIPQGAVPEPSTYGLMGAAALLGAVMARRRLQAKKSA